MGTTYRAAGAADADAVAALHADSWRRHYRGAYSDGFLDGDVLADRRAGWAARLAGPAGSAAGVGEGGGGGAGGVGGGGVGGRPPGGGPGRMGEGGGWGEGRA